MRKNWDSYKWLFFGLVFVICMGYFSCVVFASEPKSLKQMSIESVENDRCWPIILNRSDVFDYANVIAILEHPASGMTWIKYPYAYVVYDRDTYLIFEAIDYGIKDISGNLRGKITLKVIEYFDHKAKEVHGWARGTCA